MKKIFSTAHIVSNFENVDEFYKNMNNALRKIQDSGHEAIIHYQVSDGHFCALIEAVEYIKE